MISRTEHEPEAAMDERVMERLTGKTLAGMGMRIGIASFFFDDGTMATVTVEPRDENEAPRDVILTVGTYEQED